MIDLVELMSSTSAIVGTTGAGKTYLAKGVVELLLAQGRRVIIIDPTGAWYGLRAGADGDEKGGYPVIIFGGDHADVEIGKDGEAGKALALALAERDVQAIIDISDMTGGEKNRFLVPFLENLYAKNRAVLHLIVDEADEIAAQRPADGEQRLLGAFDKIVRRGRIKGFRPMMISQRPAVIHKNVLSQIGTLIALKLTSPQDRKAIDDWVKGNADADQAKEVMRSLPTLGRGEGWVWAPALGVLERVSFPPITTFDSSRTPEIGEYLSAPALARVDVSALRKAVAPKVEGKTTATLSANKNDISAAEHRGYERGLAAGLSQGKAAGFSLGLARAQKAISALALEGTTVEPTKPQATPTHVSKPDKPVALPTVAEGLSPALQRCLDAVQWWHDIGFAEVERNRAAIIAGLSPTASTFGVYIGKLRDLGLLENGTPGKILLTESGAKSANRSGDTNAAQVLESAIALLDPKPAMILKMLGEAYPNSLSRHEIADALSLSRTASTLGVYISKASRLGFIDNAEPGRVRAAGFLFPEQSI